MLLQRLRRETSEIQARAYTGSEALVRACAVYTSCLVYYGALAVQCETIHGVIPPRVMHFSAIHFS